MSGSVIGYDDNGEDTAIAYKHTRQVKAWGTIFELCSYGWVKYICGLLCAA
jgi:hypothetical protein